MLRYLFCLTENQVKNLVTGKTVLSLLVAILTAQLGLAQTTYYLDAQNGSDANGNGTQNSPWQSFDKAYQNASNGDIINLTGTFDWTKSSQPINGANYYRIKKDLKIRGQGAEKTIIQGGPRPNGFINGSGQHNNGVFLIKEKNNSNNPSVTISNITIRHADQEICIFNQYGNLSLENVSVRFGEKGGLDNGHKLSVQNSTFTDNKKYGLRQFALAQKKMKLINCTIAGNIPRGIKALNGKIIIRSSTIMYNGYSDRTDTVKGAGIYADVTPQNQGSKIKLYNTIVAENNSLLRIQNNFIPNEVDKDGNISILDKGGNVFGVVNKGGKYLNIHPTSWYDCNGCNSGGDLVFDEKGSSLTGELEIENYLSMNNTNNGTKTIAVDNSNSILIGQAQVNGFPFFYFETIKDQRGKKRSVKPTIGAYEAKFPPDNNHALDFDGSDDFVQVNDSFPSNGMSALTLEAWVKVDDNNINSNQRIISRWRPNQAYQFFICGSNCPNGPSNSLAFEISGTSGSNWFAAGYDLTDNWWHHVAGVYDGNTMKIFIDGKKVGQQSANLGKVSDLNQTLGIGAFNDGSNDFFSGKIKEVRIWSEARSASEIRTNMYRSLKYDKNELVAYYRFNQSTASTSVPNLVANQFTGTLKNMDPSSDWTSSDAFTTWQGDINRDWSVSNNWTNGAPSSWDNVGIYKSSYFGSHKPTIYGNVAMNNLVIGPSSNLQLYGNITINSGFLNPGNLYLERKLYMNGNTLTLGRFGNVLPQGGSSSKYVIGTVKKEGNQAFKFPIGDGSKYAPIKISAPADLSDAFTASYSSSSHSNTSSMAPQSNNPDGNDQLNNVSTVEHWDLNRTNGSSSVDVTLYWKDGAPASSNIDSLGDLKVAHWNGSAWENLGQDTTNGDTTSGSITVNNVSNFSPFTFGSTSSDGNALPVELFYFKAIAKEGHAELNWATASETNNSHFIVQKRVDDAWKQIGKVQGQGTTTEEHQYQLEDPEVEKGNTYYYRLEQVDFDGSYAYSDVKSLRFEGIRSKGSLLVYPNPVQQVLKYRLEAPVSQEVTLQIINAYGNQVKQVQTTVSQGTSRQSISVKGLKPGQYILRLQARDQVYQKQFFKVE